MRMANLRSWMMAFIDALLAGREILYTCYGGRI
jgi:hypothetical protein